MQESATRLSIMKLKAREILAKESAKERIKELRRVELYSADSLRPALTEKLMKIADECSDSLYISTKTGLPANPAAMRSVAVSAIKTLSDMYGIKEDVAHHISIGGDDNGGDVIFNVIMPEKRDKKDEEGIV